ncbi:Uncharacterized conserved protein, contains FHA domain [Delftia tsuruhatensis]|uniref:FHA domain-containing protein n=1 Tax=Delftia tsuruhatensis TaxID=180282 RepID=UPI001E6D1AD4|nr:FHA domain-containing protein [Delftia tsuruhatensis]CAB5712594.1 Uncharacterized conserved protein, contains FHA domain [Delftia tsuruhatensis]CAC9681956.1 Uncharacterized conserved protein, contains FHA domain [Delftia tsuruhatensis]
MALLHNQLDGRRVVLRPMHTFGRHPSLCQTVMKAPDVSQVHALIRWNRQAWEIVDQSRNGTMLNGVRLAAGNWTALSVGARLSMGEGDASAWTVQDLSPPLTCLCPSQGPGPVPDPRQILPLNPRGNLLPNAQEPEVNLLLQDSRWVLESVDGMETLRDGAMVVTSAGNWEFVLCDDLESTREIALAPAAAPLPDVSFCFEVSQNEEHARLSLRINGTPVPLGERIHHYTLVTLARLRQQDALKGIAAQSQGWVELEELSRMLGVEPSYVNIQIFRAKHQILGALPHCPAAPALVERRRGSLRFGDYPFEIRGGARASAM